MNESYQIAICLWATLVTIVLVVTVGIAAEQAAMAEERRVRIQELKGTIEELRTKETGQE